jgi:hypothetical protein
MTRDDILAYLNNCRKSEEIDPLHCLYSGMLIS